MSGLTHIDAEGRARMVDVSDKPETAREAVAEGFVRLAPETLALAVSGQGRKGDVRAVAEIAGVMAAKPVFANHARLQGWLARLEVALKADDRTAADSILDEAIPDFSRRHSASPGDGAPEPSRLAAASRP